ncbi:MAG TPA: hypothetical protein VGE79_18695 [Niastella sp.]
MLTSLTDYLTNENIILASDANNPASDVKYLTNEVNHLTNERKQPTSVGNHLTSLCGVLAIG